MDKATLSHLCELSKLNYSDAEQAEVIAQMGDIINLMDTIKDYDITYDDTKDNNEINYGDLREDEPQRSYTAESLQQNTEPRDNCYVVPKMME